MGNDDKNLIGTKFYCYNENKDTIILRVIGYQNDDIIVVRDESTKSKYKIKLDDLKEQYTRLIPDGLLCVSNVAITDDGSVEDVIVSYCNMSDILSGNNIASIVCRQNVLDIFDFAHENRQQMVGVCATPRSMPEGTNYGDLFACSNVYKTVFVSTYIDDELDDILSSFKHKEFDKVLDKLFEFQCSRYNPSLGRKMIENIVSNTGYTTNLKDLLELNGFIEEFYLVNGILKVNFDIRILPNINRPDTYNVIALEEILGIKFNTFDIIEYGKDIDLNRLDPERYIIIKDKSNKMWVAQFTSDSVIDLNKIDYVKLYSNREYKSKKW